MEKWRSVKGYEGIYEVSDMGNIRNMRGVVLKQRLHKGYHIVNLSKNGRKSTHLVSRLVAKAWIPNEQKKSQVNHINEITTDNRVSNLEWVTAKENSNHGTRNQRISESVKELHDNGYYNGIKNRKNRNKLLMINLTTGTVEKTFNSIIEANKFVGACKSNGNISMVCNGKRNKAYGYDWKFV